MEMYLHFVNVPSRHVEVATILLLFVNLGKNAYGRGLYWDMVPVFEMLQEQNRGFVVLCLVYCKQSN
jgi:hypothetical protein